jgi:hypothetical protein
LYVGGDQYLALSGYNARGVLAWDGASWSWLARGLGGYARGITTYDSGNGPEIYVGGRFHSAGSSVSARNIVKWDGANWTSLGSGVGDPTEPSTHEVVTLTSFDDGQGPSLFVGGFFATAGGQQAFNIAKWNGQSWFPVGGGLTGSLGRVNSLQEFHGELYAGGAFSMAGNAPASRIAKWNGTAWSDVASGMSGGSGVEAMTIFDDGSGPALFVAGNFSFAGQVPANSIAKWDGSAWHALGSGVKSNTTDERPGNVLALATYNDGTGDALYVGGVLLQSEMEFCRVGVSY